MQEPSCKSCSAECEIPFCTLPVLELGRDPNKDGRKGKPTKPWDRRLKFTGIWLMHPFERI